MKLLNNRILVKPVEKQENKTESGIFLGLNNKTENDFEVLIIGDKVENIKVGDIVRKYKYSSGIPIEYNKQKCIILCENSDIEFVL